MAATAGSWSDWQPGYVVGGRSQSRGGSYANTVNALVDIPKRSPAAGGTDTGTYPAQDLIVLGTQAVAQARGVSNPSFTSRGNAPLATVSAQKSGNVNTSTGFKNFDWRAQVQLAEQGYEWEAVPPVLASTQPAPMAGLRQGTDWDYGPDGGWQWETSELPEVTWDDIPVMVVGTYSAGNSGAVLQVGSATTSFSAAVEYFAVPGNPLNEGVLTDLSSAVKIGEATLNFTLVQGLVNANGMISPSKSNTVWAVSAVGQHNKIAIVSRLKAARTGGAELFIDLPEIPQTANGNRSNNYTYNLGSSASIGTNNGPQPLVNDNLSQPTYTVQMPRWRYWIVERGYWGVRL